MLYALRGTFKGILPPNKILIETPFLLWEVIVPFKLIEGLRETFLQREVNLFVVPILRKNEYVELYGFLDQEERELFLKLNTLSKVGPKLAINILSVFSPETLRNLIYEKKVEELAKVPGIGIKKAEKLYLELRNLFGRFIKKGFIVSLESERIISEARASLLSLGFKPQEAEEVLLKVYEERDSIEDLIRKALKELAPSVKEERL